MVYYFFQRHFHASIYSAAFKKHVDLDMLLTLLTKSNTSQLGYPIKKFQCLPSSILHVESLKYIIWLVQGHLSIKPSSGQAEKRSLFYEC